MSAKKAPRIPLPKSWTKHVRSAMLHIISLAQYAAIYTRSWAVDSIAVVERMIKTVKVECTRRVLVSLRRQESRRELLSFADWYNEHRPHTTLQGRTPNEVYFKRWPANRKPRIEPRPRWPRPSPCANPQALVAGHPGDRFNLNVEHHDGRRHLPIVRLLRAA